MKTYLSAKQVVTKLNNSLSLRQVYRLCETGKLRSNRRLGKLLIEEDSLVELLAPAPQQTPKAPESVERKPRPRRTADSPVDLW